MINQSYIFNIKRTPIGKYGGKLSQITAPDLEALVIKDLLRNFPTINKKIDEVIIGNVISAGLGQNPARKAAIMAGLADNIPSFTVNKVCASGLKSIALAVQSIGLGESECVIAGGMENMSQSPYLIKNYRFGAKYGNQIIADSLINDGIWCSIIDQHMGFIAEKLANKYEISREKQDKFSLLSHRKALSAILNDRFKSEITPIFINENMVKQDEGPREDTSLIKLQKLRPAFIKKGTITAGNASTLNDGAAAALLASEKFLKKNKIKPMVKILSFGIAALNPKYFGLGAYIAVKKCLQKTNIDIKKIDLWEINEAFACQALAVIKLLKIDKKTVNVNGGAIALGHPIGASGSRILATLIYELKRNKLKYGIASLCAGGGQGIAVLIENII